MGGLTNEPWTQGRGAEIGLVITARLEASAVSSCFKSVWIFQFLWLYLPNQDKRILNLDMFTDVQCVQNSRTIAQQITAQYLQIIAHGLGGGFVGCVAVIT